MREDFGKECAARNGSGRRRGGGGRVGAGRCGCKCGVYMGVGGSL